MAAGKTLNDLTPIELKEIIDYIVDAYNNRSVTRPKMLAELEITYNLSPAAADKIQEAVTRARIRPYVSIDK